jgi:ATP-dependent RNA helicase DHX36
MGLHWAVYTEKVYLGVVSLSQVSEVPDMSLLLFGGAVTSQPSSDPQRCTMAMNEGWIKFDTSQATARVVQRTRTCMEELLMAKLANTGVDVTKAAKPLIEAVLGLLWSENTGSSTAAKCLSEVSEFRR